MTTEPTRSTHAADYAKREGVELRKVEWSREERHEVDGRYGSAGPSQTQGKEWSRVACRAPSRRVGSGGRSTIFCRKILHFRIEPNRRAVQPDDSLHMSSSGSIPAFLVGDRIAFVRLGRGFQWAIDLASTLGDRRWR
jgi:hypothetical protein